MNSEQQQEESLSAKLGSIKAGLRSDLEISRQVKNGNPHYVVHDPVSFQSHVFTLEDYRIIGALDERITLQETFNALLAQETFVADDEEDFFKFVLALRMQNLLSNSGGQGKELYEKQKKTQEAQKKAGIMRLLSIRIPLVNPDAFLTKTISAVSFLFSTWFFILWLIVGSSAIYVLVRRYSEFTEPLNGLLALENIPYLVFSMIGLKVWHELGHGYACKYFGGKVPEMGTIIMMGMPLAYVDASAAWSFERRRQRLLVMLGGMYFESMLAIAAVFVWAFSNNGFLSACAYQTILTASVVTVLFNANPLMRYDGYFVATEVLRIQNLRQIATNELKRFTKSIFLGIESEPNSEQSGYVRTIALIYGICSGIYMNLLLFSIAAMLAYQVPVGGIIFASYYIIFSLNQKLGALQKYLFSSDEAKTAGIRAKVIGVLCFIVLPPLIVFAPTPFRITVTGLLSSEVEHEVRSLVAGTVTEIPVSVGQTVEPETTVAKLSNPKLTTELDTARAEVNHARLVRKAMVDVDRVKFKQFTYVLTRASKELEDKSREFSALDVCAGKSGIVASLPHKKQTGRFINVGDPVATIVTGAQSVRCYLTESQILQTSCCAGEEVFLSFIGHPLSTRSATVTSVAPTAEGEFADSALTQLGGGEILVDSQTGRALEPVFRIEIRPNKELKRDLVGQRLMVNFPKDYEPLGWFAVRKVKDFITSVRVQ